MCQGVGDVQCSVCKRWICDWCLSRCISCGIVTCNLEKCSHYDHKTRRALCLFKK